MSFSDKPTLSKRYKMGCSALAFLLIAFNAWLLAGAAMGHCAPAPDGTGCENDALIRWMMFPGFLFISIAMMAVAAWFALKRKD